jgi:hypothetical protein
MFKKLFKFKRLVRKFHINHFCRNQDVNYWQKVQTWFFFVSLCFSFGVWAFDQYQKAWEKKLQFVLSNIEKIDLRGMKSTFSDMLFEFGPHTCAHNLIDISVFDEIQIPDQKSKDPTLRDDVSKKLPVVIPSKKGRRIDLIINSKKYRRDNPEYRYIDSVIHNQLLRIQYALATLKKLDIDKYDPRFYYARDGLNYLGRYFESCRIQQEKNNISFDHSEGILKKIDRETFMSCEFLYKNRDDPKCKHIKTMYERLKRYN